MVIREHKICVALSESLYWKQAYFQVFDGTSIERTIAPPSDESESILNHSNIRSDIRKKLALWPLRSTKFLLPTSEALKWKHAYFQLFDGTSIERAMAPPSDGSGSI